MTDRDDEDARHGADSESTRHEAMESAEHQDDHERELGVLLAAALSEEERSAPSRESFVAIERRIRAIEAGNLSRLEVVLATGALIVAGLTLAPVTVALAALVRADGLAFGLAPLLAGALAAAVTAGIDRLIQRR